MVRAKGLAHLWAVGIHVGCQTSYQTCWTVLPCVALQPRGQAMEPGFRQARYMDNGSQFPASVPPLSHAHGRRWLFKSLR